MPKDWQGLLKATVLTGVLLLFALGVRELEFEDSNVGVFTLLCGAFLFAFAMVSGRLAKVDGPGGVSATFHSFFEKHAETLSSLRIGDPVDANELASVAKEGMAELADNVSMLEPNKHVSLVLQLGRQYDAWAIEEYNKALSRRAKSVTIVIVDEAGKFVGNLRPSQRRAAPFLRPKELEQLVSYLRDYPQEPDNKRFRMSTKAFSVNLTRYDALKYFVDNDTDHLVMVDARGRPSSIVFRNDILQALLSRAHDN